MAAVSGLKPPGPLSLCDNNSAAWKEWYRAYSFYAVAAGVVDKDEHVQCCVFLHIAGPEAQRLHETMTFNPAEVNKIGPLVQKFKTFCEGKKNLTVTRYQFFERKGWRKFGLRSKIA